MNRQSEIDNLTHLINTIDGRYVSGQASAEDLARELVDNKETPIGSANRFVAVGGMKYEEKYKKVLEVKRVKPIDYEE